MGREWAFALFIGVYIYVGVMDVVCLNLCGALCVPGNLFAAED